MTKVSAKAWCSRVSRAPNDAREGVDLHMSDRSGAMTGTLVLSLAHRVIGPMRPGGSYRVTIEEIEEGAA